MLILEQNTLLCVENPGRTAAAGELCRKDVGEVISLQGQSLLDKYKVAVLWVAIVSAQECASVVANGCTMKMSVRNRRDDSSSVRLFVDLV